MTFPKPLFSSAVTALVLGMVVSMSLSVSGCNGHCECPEPEVLPLPSDGVFDFETIRITDHYDGGDSDEWRWHDAGSPWGDMTEGQIQLEGQTMTVEYATENGSFRLEMEEN